MIPDYVEREAELRLGDQYDRALPRSVKIKLIRAAGIDLGAACAAGPSPEEAFAHFRLSEADGKPIIGAYEFDLHVQALGFSTTQNARAIYLVTTLNEEDLRLEDEVYFGCVAVDFEVLLWEHPEEYAADATPLRLPAPQWRRVAPGVVPEAIRLLAEAEALKDAFARAYGSNLTRN